MHGLCPSTRCHSFCLVVSTSAFQELLLLFSDLWWKVVPSWTVASPGCFIILGWFFLSTVLFLKSPLALTSLQSYYLFSARLNRCDKEYLIFMVNFVSCRTKYDTPPPICHLILFLVYLQFLVK